jgi:hypothetical protein
MFHRLYLFYLDPIIAPNAADMSEVAAAASKEEAEEEEEYGFYMQAGDDEGGSADEDLPRPEGTKEEYKSSRTCGPRRSYTRRASAWEARFMARRSRTSRPAARRTRFSSIASTFRRTT